MTTQLLRDSFARATLTRDTVPKHLRKDCAWCGLPARFVYWWDSDSFRDDRPSNGRQFCSVGCFRAFHG